MSLLRGSISVWDRELRRFNCGISPTFENWPEVGLLVVGRGWGCVDNNLELEILSWRRLSGRSHLLGFLRQILLVDPGQHVVYKEDKRNLATIIKSASLRLENEKYQCNSLTPLGRTLCLWVGQYQRPPLSLRRNDRPPSHDETCFLGIEHLGNLVSWSIIKETHLEEFDPFFFCNISLRICLWSFCRIVGRAIIMPT